MFQASADYWLCRWHHWPCMYLFSHRCFKRVLITGCADDTIDLVCTFFPIDVSTECWLLAVQMTPLTLYVPFFPIDVSTECWLLAVQMTPLTLYVPFSCRCFKRVLITGCADDTIDLVCTFSHRCFKRVLITGCADDTIDLVYTFFSVDVSRECWLLAVQMTPLTLYVPFFP